MHDDETVGHLFSRREAIALLGARGAAWLTHSACGSPSGAGACVVRPEQIEGPYFVDERLNRSDIRSDPATGRRTPGKPLTLTLVVSRLTQNDCKPLADAQVDLWQCDAAGVYSDVQDPGFNTVGQKFLRGHQITGDDGAVRFVTVYPGWYPGRTVHLHFKIRTRGSSRTAHELTSQLYFDDALTDRVHAEAPYAARGQRGTRNRSDGIFRRGGDQLMLDVAETREGLNAAFAIAMQF